MNQRTILAYKFSWNPATVRAACTEILKYTQTEGAQARGGRQHHPSEQNLVTGILLQSSTLPYSDHVFFTQTSVTSLLLSDFFFLHVP